MPRKLGADFGWGFAAIFKVMLLLQQNLRNAQEVEFVVLGAELRRGV